MLAAAPARAQSRDGPAAIERTIPREKPALPAEPAVRTSLPEAEGGAAITGRFVLGAVHIEGAAVFSSDQLAATFEPLLATEVDQAQLAGVVAAITQRYRDAGYLLSYAVLPEQNVRSGIVRINVVEGYVDDLAIEGAGPHEVALLAAAAPILIDRPLRAQTLERVIGLLRDRPGILVTDVRIRRTPGDPARHALTIVVQRDTVRALAYADNRGTDPAGRVRLYASSALSSLAAPGDELRLDLFAIPGDDYHYLYGQAAAAAPIGRDGIRLGVSASLGDRHQRLAAGTLSGEARNLSVQLSYPIVRSRALTAVARGSFNDWRSVDAFGGVRIQRDRMRAARLALELSSVTTSRIDAEIAIAQGLGFDGATRRGDPLASRPDAGSRFTKASAALQAAQPLSAQWTLRFAVAGQYTSRPLLSVEEFALGGNRIGRAFDFNILTGDHGVGGGLELAWRAPDSPRGATQIELFGFADGGVVFEAHRVSGQPDRSRALASAGGGVRFTLAGISLSAELGAPLRNRGVSNSPRAFVSAFKTF